MPISLPPISRRTFLARSLLAGAGLALAPKLLAAEKARDENCWALLADPHIAADRTTVSRTVNMAGQLTAVGRDIMGLPARPGGALVVGDCAFSNGQKEDYATFTKLLEPLRESGTPVHLALGNHDNRERFWGALSEEQAIKRPVADRQTLLLRSPRANWFVLDSLETTLSTPGLLGPEQLDWLARALDENSDRPALIVIHHNPAKLSNVEGVKDTEELYKVIRPRKQVKAYFFGHTHNWGVTQDESGIHLINLPPVSYIFKEGNPNGWVQATLTSVGAKLELRCVDPTHKAHGQITDLKWRV
jgi:3',5'-cyclic-AMP phosphodiesterase